MLGLFLLGACSLAGAQDANLTPVTFIPQWFPQAQFAGYYVAYEKGFYRRHGLAVKILRGGPAAPASEAVARGQATFGTMFLATGIEKRAQGVKVVNIAQIVQRSALMLVAKKASGIEKPEDINGKKVSLWANEFQLQPQAFFRKHHLQVRLVPQTGTLNLFLRGGVEVASAMWYNEYHQILSHGVNPDELTTFFMADYGMNSPEDGIYCLEETLKAHPDHCRAFVTASVEGWQYAFAHPEEALDIVMRYVNEAKVATDRVHQKWMLEKMQAIIEPPGWERPMGTLKPEAYARVARGLQNAGLIRAIPAYAAFYHDCARSHEK
ncbi:MAG: ABC transporter substrate-binding protein [Syntrophobacterales bacterium]|nr:ABC transporter substrate-binding protein [Syntrophobacterales bacterium]